MTALNEQTVPSLSELNKRISDLEHMLSHVIEDSNKMRTAIQLLSNEYLKIMGVEEPTKPLFEEFDIKIHEEKPADLESFKLIFSSENELSCFMEDDEGTVEEIKLNESIETKALSEFVNQKLTVGKVYWMVVYGISEEKPDEFVGEPS